MKEFIEVLPTVTAPVKSETLVMYLAASEESISVVMMAKRGKRQIPVLQRYFQAHPIKVLSDKPIKQVLTRPEKSGHIAKWAIKLGEHEIEFKRRNSIKGKVLAGFLAETPSTRDKETKVKETKRKEPDPDLENTWKLFTDRASSFDGFGAGLMLVSPEGKEYTYALIFEFETTINEAKYEAQLAGLRIATKMKIQELSIFIDS
ncbi:reverse transcriptase domain-containing protein [Tanacetum coccineum]